MRDEARRHRRRCGQADITASRSAGGAPPWPSSICHMPQAWHSKVSSYETLHPKRHSDSIDTLRLRADFGNFHQRAQRMQEDTGRDGRSEISDTLIRKGDAEPLNLSGFELDLLSLPLHGDFASRRDAGAPHQPAPAARWAPERGCGREDRQSIADSASPSFTGGRNGETES
jgi:hypothetical protein